MDDLVPVQKAVGEIEQEVNLQRNRVARKIAQESENLIDELLLIIYNHDLDTEGHPVVEPRVKLSAIAMLLDRGVPKLGVEHTKSDAIEESGTRKKIREEIAAMVKANGIGPVDGVV